MHQDPFAVATNGDGDGFHQRSAVGVAIAGNVVVDVPAPETRGAVVSMGGAWGVGADVEVATTAAERAAAGG